MKHSRLFGIALLLCLFTSFRTSAHSPTEEMSEAANNFLASLTPEQQTKARFELKDDERKNWHFIPKDRKGLPIKEMTPAQRNLAHALLSTGMSQRGYVKAVTIMSLEQVLQELEGAGRRFPRDVELYFLTIFGNPGDKEAWGWRFEGHHLAINFTVVNGKDVSATPSFMGTNPAEVREGPRKGLRVLAEEEDLARQLVKSFNEEQKKTAIYTNTAPADIITAAERKATVLATTGLAASRMNKGQSKLLLELIREYVYRHRAEVADHDLARIQKAGFNKIHFAWAGGLERGQPHYYRIQGPTFLMEYDNTQNNANHIHAVWRDFENDFGDDLLRKHYDQTPHAK